MPPSLTPPAADLAALARDICIYGEHDLAGVLRAHNISQERYDAEIAVHPVVVAEMRAFKEMTAKDPAVAVRMAAKQALLSGIPMLHADIQNPETEPKARVAAVQLLATMADVMPKESKNAATGPTLVLNIGAQQQTLAPMTIDAPMRELT